jgi:hypothetical protein
LILCVGAGVLAAPEAKGKVSAAPAFETWGVGSRV